MDKFKNSSNFLSSLLWNLSQLCWSCSCERLCNCKRPCLHLWFRPRLRLQLQATTSSLVASRAATTGLACFRSSFSLRIFSTFNIFFLPRIHTSFVSFVQSMPPPLSKQSIRLYQNKIQSKNSLGKLFLKYEYIWILFYTSSLF